MLIEDLKNDWPLIYEAALVRLKNIGKKYHSNLSIMAGFDWYATTQGGWFWEKVNRSNFEEALKICPHLDHRTKSVYNFKVGDKVKIPTVPVTVNNLKIENCTAVYKARKGNQDFLYIVEIFHDKATVGVDKVSRNSTFYIKDLELYEKSVKNIFIWEKNDFKGTTITLENEEQVRIFQEYVLSIGIKWNSGDDFVKELIYRTFSIGEKYNLCLGRTSNFKIITLDECIPHWRELTEEKILVGESEPLTWDLKVEPWSVGTYLVSLKEDAIGGGEFNKGVIGKIEKPGTITIKKEIYYCSKSKKEEKGIVKWFATKEEAEKFSFDLLNPSNKWKPGDSYVNIVVTGTSGNVERNNSTITFREHMSRLTTGYWAEPEVKVWDPYMTSGVGNRDSSRLDKFNHLADPILEPIKEEKYPKLELVRGKKKLLGTVVSTNNINLK